MGVVVLSPHLDDAVLSAYAQVAAGARVVSIFAGVPSEAAPATGWDLMCGFASPAAHARARIDEDERVMSEHASSWERWGFMDWQNREYGPRPEPELAELLREATSEGDELWAPVSVLSPSPHPDHMLTRDAAIASGRAVVLYADLPHCLKQVGAWPAPIGIASPPRAWMEAPALTFTANRVDLALATVERKAEAMRAYASQFKPLGRLRDQASRGVLRRPEVYGVEVFWRLK